MRGTSDGYPFAEPVAFEDLHYADAIPVSDAIPEYIHSDAHAVTDYHYSLAGGHDADAVPQSVTEHDHGVAVAEHGHYASGDEQCVGHGGDEQRGGG
jgi:hypothetical protein